MKKNIKPIRVVELFAGVGGFRLGLESLNSKKKKDKFDVVWSNQWEPGAATQHASDIYVEKFGKKGHSNADIQEVIEKSFHEIEDHNLLVGGFPCQDYSVARTLKQAKGLVGKKGVLWWSIYNILKKKGKNAPNFLMLENVDRLLKSPSAQRGRDFAIMLASLNGLGYVVEWRVINAAEYGMPQRRRRVFILGYKKGTDLYARIKKEKDIRKWIYADGVIAKAFPVKKEDKVLSQYKLEGDLSHISEKFSAEKPSKSPFEVAGVMVGGKVYTTKVTPNYVGKSIMLGDVLEDEKKVKIPEEFFIKESDIKRWEYQKGGKKEPRKTKDGHEYEYSEGPMVFPDPLDRPSRTIVTGEGGSSASRFKHVIRTKSGKLRRLMPVELERLNMFPSGHTERMHGGKITPNVKRAFLMGNALVVGVIERLGRALVEEAGVSF